jgi:hypothetical protein
VPYRRTENENSDSYDDNRLTYLSFKKTLQRLHLPGLLLHEMPPEIRVQFAFVSVQQADVIIYIGSPAVVLLTARIVWIRVCHTQDVGVINRE